ncbi:MULTISPECIES: RNA polymerase sigma-70 factor [Xanthocytophaga]|uniref:RNA polymerase sigma-70 factor n=2 Tax=Xanthocytophaga TaxID=3078918 RepID=A0AAE3U8T1_9BACT|nr:MULTISPECIES: RNA polymerase sigma-70 factor [Xanthocytophaga]MDJ1470490.1 RNA polymerase sigma-70 factor [Xanthocytophaga flavus]MDJ1482972.1 RNA polymerase sigma-70 factor [Xanthocytophaga flavus]MDJ1504263.1 RNA polymerase sigma-70 factor [Xanthocytophaga agilis]
MPSLNYSHLSDSELLELMKLQDDQDAFREVYKRHWRSVFLVAYKKLHDKELAEEFTQNLFVDVWEKRSENTIRQLPSYLFGALKFTIINYYKSQMVHEKYVSYKHGNNDSISHTTEELVMLADLSQAIEKGMALLPPKSREVFKLSRVEHFSVKEIASLLNISEKAVEYHITQSLKQIRVHLKDYILFVLLFLFR